MRPKYEELKTSGENQQERAMSGEKKSEPKKTLYDWSFLEMKNPRPGVREKTLKYFRNNPISVTIRPLGRSVPVPSPEKRMGMERTPATE